MARHRSEVERRREVERWRGSAQSARDYCMTHGMSQASLRRWAQEVDAASKVLAPRFVRVEVAERLRDGAGLTVEIGRVRVRVERGFDSAVLRELVDVLGGTSAP